MKPNNLLKRERELRGWSQARVAEEVGTTALNVGRWERGSSMPYPHFREKLCLLFGKDARALGLLEVEEEASISDEEVPVDASEALEICDPAIPLPSAGGAHLVGRDALLERVKRSLCTEAKPAMVALHGLPGVGKTALAIELVYNPDVRAYFQQGILWIGPGLRPDITELLSRWGALLGVTAAGARLNTSEDWARAIRAAIGQRRMLLVIDDAWNGEEALAFQVGGPRCSYLVTTRYPNLAVQLAAEGALAVPELTEEDGVALLARYASEFVRQAPETALALVHSVGALPLALTLMGKYLSVQVYSGQPRRLHAAVEHLRDARTRLQLSEARALAARHPSLANGATFSLQSLITVSEQLLDDYARSALRALSLFPPKPHSFTEEAALEICQISTETLDQLCDAGLLESNGPSRYMLHQTIADYARDTLTDPAISERMVSYYVRFVEEHMHNHELLKLEMSNILAALEVAYTSHQRAELARGVCALADFLHARGLYSLAEKHLKRAYEAANILGDSRRVVGALLYLGLIEQDWGNLDQAETFLLEGLELAQKADLREQITDLLRTIGMVEDTRGNSAQAEACFREGLEMARKLGQQEQVCRLLTGLGVRAGKAGHYEQAEAYLREGLDLARQLEYNERMIALLHNLGRIAYERGNYQQAEEYYQESLEKARCFGYEVSCGAAQVRLGELALRRGHFAQSHTYLAEALSVLRQVGDTHLWLYDALYCLGVLAMAEGDDREAERYFQECLGRARRAGIRETVVDVLAELAQLEIERGDYEKAEGYLREAGSLARELDLNYLKGTILYAWGELNLRRQQFENATLNFVETRATISQDHRELQTLALYGLARVAYACHDLPAARQQGEASLAVFTSIGHYRAAEIANWLKCLDA